MSPPIDPRVLAARALCFGADAFDAHVFLSTTAAELFSLSHAARGDEPQMLETALRALAFRVELASELAEAYEAPPKATTAAPAKATIKPSAAKKGGAS